MRECRFRLVILWTLIGIAFCTGHTGVAKRISLGRMRDLLKDAPLVLKGSVVNITPSVVQKELYPRHVAPAFRFKKAFVVVTGVLKGNCDGSEVTVAFPESDDADDALTILTVGQTYLFFLDSTHAGIRFFNPQHGACLLTPGPFTKTGGDCETQARAEFERSLQATNVEVTVTALRALSSIGDAHSLETMQRFLGSSDERVRLTATSAALTLGDWQQAEVIVKWLERHYREDWNTYYFEEEPSLREIDPDLVSQLRTVSDPAAGPLFTALLKGSRSPWIRQGVMEALTSMRYRPSMSVMVTMLRDYRESPSVSYYAYKSIMTLRGKTYTIPELFNKQRDDTIKEIEDWAQATGVSAPGK